MTLGPRGYSAGAIEKLFSVKKPTVSGVATLARLKGLMVSLQRRPVKSTMILGPRKTLACKLKP